MYCVCAFFDVSIYLPTHTVPSLTPGHATAAIGIAQCAWQQGLHSQCVDACQRALSLLNDAAGDMGEAGVDVAGATVRILQLMAGAYDATGKVKEAIKCVVCVGMLVHV